MEDLVVPPGVHFIAFVPRGERAAVPAVVLDMGRIVP